MLRLGTMLTLILATIVLAMFGPGPDQAPAIEAAQGNSGQGGRPATRSATPTGAVPPVSDTPTATVTFTPTVVAPSPTPYPAPTWTEIDENAMLFDSDRTGNFQIFAVGLNGQELADPNSITQLTNDPQFDSWWARIRPGGREVLFYRTPKGVHDTDFSKTSLWLMNADGSGQRQLRAPQKDGWIVQGHAEWSPDGTRMAMFGGSSSNPRIFITDAEGQNPQVVTNRSGFHVDPSWLNDTQLLFITCKSAGCLPKGYDIFRINTDGTGLTQVTSNNARDHDPYVSPTGGRIAWIQQSDLQANGGGGVWSIWVMNSNGTGAVNITRDRDINSVPHWRWSPNERWIYFHRVGAPANRFGIHRIDPGGGQIWPVLVDPAWNNEFPAMRPAVCFPTC